MLFVPVTVREDITQKVTFRQRAENSVASHGDPLARAFKVERGSNRGKD